MNISKEITTAIQKVVGKKSAVLHEPLFNGNELKYVQECIDSGWISSEGPFVESFEQQFAKRIGRTKKISWVQYGDMFIF